MSPCVSSSVAREVSAYAALDSWDVVTETIQPFFDAVSRLSKMGLTAAALIHCEGVCCSVYRADREDVSELLECVPDAMSELADGPPRALAPVRQKVVPGTGLTTGKSVEGVREEAPARVEVAAEVIATPALRRACRRAYKGLAAGLALN